MIMMHLLLVIVTGNSSSSSTSSRLLRLTVTWMMLLFMFSAANYSLSINASFDYGDALSKSILFLECQRSGKLPPDQRITWRGDSALSDGSDFNVDLVGGYYDAGDNVKFGFPMAFTVTVLAWGLIENADSIEAAGESDHWYHAIRWGTDYFLKASADIPTRLWVQVGDAWADHNCWERPEGMDTPRTSLSVNGSSPGTEVAAETAAALAAASIALRPMDAPYAASLLRRAHQVFDFADKFRDSFTDECPFYCTYSGYHDELVWAAAWLLKATGDDAYLEYVKAALHKVDEVAEFSWDNKFAGFAVLMSKMYMEEEDGGGGETILGDLVKSRADFFMCSNLPNNSMTSVSRTPGGLLYLRSGANTQYASGAAFLATMYSKYLAESNSNVTCKTDTYTSQDILQLAQDQVDYILGRNPLGISYMVGFGTSYPQQVHHRGASILASSSSSNVDPKWQCLDGFRLWYSRGAPNPNLAIGAIVGGPDSNDHFNDVRSNSAQLEPTTYTNALFASALARLLATTIL